MDRKIKEAFDHVTADNDLMQDRENAVIQYMRM